MVLELKCPGWSFAALSVVRIEVDEVCFHVDVRLIVPSETVSWEVVKVSVLSFVYLSSNVQFVSFIRFLLKRNLYLAYTSGV